MAGQPKAEGPSGQEPIVASGSAFNFMSGLQAPPERKESEELKKVEEEKALPVQRESFNIPSYDDS